MKIRESRVAVQRMDFSISAAQLPLGLCSFLSDNQSFPAWKAAGLDKKQNVVFIPHVKWLESQRSME